MRGHAVNDDVFAFLAEVSQGLGEVGLNGKNGRHGPSAELEKGLLSVIEDHCRLQRRVARERVVNIDVRFVDARNVRVSCPKLSLLPQRLVQVLLGINEANAEDLFPCFRCIVVQLKEVDPL